MQAPEHDNSQELRSRRLAFTTCVLVGLAWAALHLVAFPREVLPLTYAIPLMFCVWTRSRSAVWIMATAFAILAALKVFWLLPPGAHPAQWPALTLAARGVNIFISAAIVHIIISLNERLLRKGRLLERANAELQTANQLIFERNKALELANDRLTSLNRELSDREQEISVQNEELQTQSEELAQQNEELQSQGEELEQQTEELTAQTEELQALNDELNRRERMLESLLNTVPASESKPALLETICRQGLNLLGEDVVGVSVLQETNGLAPVTAYVSRSGCEAANRTWEFDKSLARIVVLENRTACLQDARLRPDLVFPEPVNGEKIRSVLASPLRVGGQTVGALEFYCLEPRPWTQDQFRLAEWAAVQTSQVLESWELQKELEESEQRFRAIFENAGVGLAHVGRDGRFIRFNPKFCEITGYAPTELGSKTFAEITHPEDIQADLAQVRRLVSREIDSYTMKKRYLRPDGSPVWISLSASAVREADGHVLYFVAAIEDISDRKKAEQELQYAEQRLNYHVENSPLAVIEWDSQFRVSRWTKAAQRVFGWSSEELQGLHPSQWRFVHEEDQEQVNAIMSGLLDGTQLRNICKNRNYRQDGSVLDCEWYNSALTDSQGRVISVLSLALDTTERKRALEALAQNEQHLRLALEAGSMGTWAWVPETDHVEWSDNVFRMLGYDRAKVKPTTWAFIDRIHPDDRELQDHEWHESMQQHREYSCEFRIVRPDGSAHWLEARGRYIYDENQMPSKMYGVLIPVSLRKQIEQERQALLEAERAARTEAERINRLKDEFLATVSHELRSPLNAIVGWTRLLARGKAETARAVDIIDRSASSLTQLVEDLLEMSRIISGKIRLEREPADLTRIVMDVLEGVRPAADAKSIQIDLAIDPDLQMLECDPNRIQQVIWNLLTNAIKFTPAQGRVSVLVRRCASAVELVVQDTGQGISPEFLPHVFDRFRQADGSIARKHGGLGLGLSIVKHLVELHGGTVWAESPGEHKGASFTVSLPCGGQAVNHVRASDLLSHKNAENHDHSKQASGSDQIAGLRILVADDDAHGCELLSRVLTEAGAVVRTADCAETALRLLTESRPDVLISDIGMSGQDGYSFVRTLRSSGREWADLTCLALTALARSEDRKRALEAGFDDHLGKPFDPGTLIGLVWDLVARNRARSRPVGDLFPASEPSNKPDEDPTSAS